MQDVLYYTYQHADAATRHMIAVRLSRAMRERIYGCDDISISVGISEDICDGVKVKEISPIIELKGRYHSTMIYTSYHDMLLTCGDGSRDITSDGDEIPHLRVVIRPLPKYIILHYTAIVVLALKHSRSSDGWLRHIYVGSEDENADSGVYSE